MSKNSKVNHHTVMAEANALVKGGKMDRALRIVAEQEGVPLAFLEAEGYTR